MCSLQGFIRNLSEAHELSGVEHSATHPLHTLIHRRVSIAIASSVEEPRQKLASARIPFEITAENRNSLLTMHDLQGISCSCRCIYGGQVKAGCICYIEKQIVTEEETSLFLSRTLPTRK